MIIVTVQIDFSTISWSEKNSKQFFICWETLQFSNAFNS